MARGRKPGSKNGAGAPAKPTLAFEATLWAAADKLRGNMDAAEYKHVALGLIFLKYISDRFEERRAKALALPIHDDLRFGAYAAFGTSGRTGSFGFFTA